MKIARVQYKRDGDHYPYLEFLFNGETVKVSAAAMKRSVLQLGYAYLGSAWSKKVPPIDVVVGDKSFRMTGGIKDDDLAKLELKFLNDLDTGLASPS